MTNTLAVNQLIQWSLDSGSVTERILWIDEGYVIAYVIDISCKKAFPKVRTLSEIRDALKTEIASIQAEDSLIKLVLEDDIQPKDKYIRDQAWNIIKTMVAPENEPMIYRRDVRGPQVQEAIKQHGVTDKTGLTP